MIFSVLKASADCIKYSKCPSKSNLYSKNQKSIVYKIANFSIFVESCGKSDQYSLKIYILTDNTSLSDSKFSKDFNFYGLPKLKYTWGLSWILEGLNVKGIFDFKCQSYILRVENMDIYSFRMQFRELISPCFCVFWDFRVRANFEFLPSVCNDHQWLFLYREVDF